jgi:DNA-binding response OmpR family regulator
MTYPDRVHTRSDLLRTLWVGAEINERTVDQTVRRLRQELERFELKNMLETLTGIGYRFRLR